MKYTGFRDRPHEERQIRFQNACRAEGRADIAFTASGTNLQLTFNHNMGPYGGHERECDFEKEHGKVSTTLPHLNGIQNSLFSIEITSRIKFLTFLFG